MNLEGRKKSKLWEPALGVVRLHRNTQRSVIRACQAPAKTANCPTRAIQSNLPNRDWPAALSLSFPRYLTTVDTTNEWRPCESGCWAKSAVFPSPSISDFPTSQEKRRWLGPLEVLTSNLLFPGAFGSLEGCGARHGSRSRPMAYRYYLSYSVPTIRTYDAIETRARRGRDGLRAYRELGGYHLIVSTQLTSESKMAATADLGVMSAISMENARGCEAT
ncbi:hypothetical protein LX36DRAFT_650117 [Colletotrichum falcatum]|nr:hypothetical protein LX36DRAFT_650117 [Colletotrichum falcatum]